MELPVLMMMLYIFMFYSKVSLAQPGGDSFSYESQPQKVLHCDVTGTERSVAWIDGTEGSVGLFIYFLNDAQPLNQSTGDNFKHSNFDYAFVEGSHFNLVINDVERTDGGSYDCFRTLAGGTAETLQYKLIVEGPPESVEITCVPVEACPADTLDPVSSSLFTCTCTAIGAYPSSLTLTWTGANESTPASLSDNSKAGYYDITGGATFTPTAAGSNTVTCAVDEYTAIIPENDRTATITFEPPVCSIVVNQTSSDCSTVVLSCECGDVKPELEQYLFYDGSGYVTQTSNQWTTEITANVPYSFSCRGCNGVNYGTESGNNNVTGTCVPSTTALPTTPTEPLTTPEATDKPDGTGEPKTGGSSTFAIIFGSIGGVVVLICLVAFLVWFFKYREGNDDHTATNPSAIDGVTNGGGPNANVDPDSLPVYAEVNREKKSKDGVQEPLNKEGSPRSTNKVEPGSNDPEAPIEEAFGVTMESKTKSAPPPDNKDPEIPAYGVVNKPKKAPEPAPRGNTMELQYADLDHGNAPPSNQIRMPEEPTEYATVQSVVV